MGFAKTGIDRIEHYDCVNLTIDKNGLRDESEPKRRTKVFFLSGRLGDYFFY